MHLTVPYKVTIICNQRLVEYKRTCLVCTNHSYRMLSRVLMEQ